MLETRTNPKGIGFKMDNKVKLEKFKVYDIDELINEGYKIARLSDNRDLKESILKKKRASLKENGMLQPGIVINARLAVDQNLEISDFESGEIIKGDEIDNYLVLVDANHRYKAHRQLLKENEGKEDREQYHYKFFVMLPLQDEINIARMLAEMNICTKVWTGNDFIRNVNSPEEQTNVMEFMSELKKKNYSLPAISIYVSWSNKITSKLLYKVLRGDIPAILKDTDHSKSVIERSKKILDAASSFGDKFLKTRVFPNWLVNRVC